MDKSHPIPIEWNDDTKDLIKNHVLNGGLIAIPTETVYGLAANALNVDSIKKIFNVKKRPLNDPIIIHVTNFIYALNNIFNVDIYQTFIIILLTNKFTPGPLTIVAKGNHNIPKILSANTGYPAVRCPDHVLALDILDYMGIPLCAPSANMFGHISPTSVDHVLSEFPNDFMYIINGGECNVGIESTVVKITSNEEGPRYNVNLILGLMKKLDIIEYIKTGKINIKLLDEEMNILNNLYKLNEISIEIIILRKGGITFEDIKNLFNDPIFKNINIQISNKFIDKNKISYSPGLLLTHYAPKIDTFLTTTHIINAVNPIHNDKNLYNKHKCKPYYNPSDIQSNSFGTAVSYPPEVTTIDPLAESSSNYLPVNGNATPGDRGGSGMKSTTGPQVEPVADLREAEGEVNREAVCKTMKAVDLTSSGENGVIGHYGDNKPHNDNKPHYKPVEQTDHEYRTSSGKPENDLWEFEGEVNREAVCRTTSGGVAVGKEVDLTLSGDAHDTTTGIVENNETASDIGFDIMGKFNVVTILDVNVGLDISSIFDDSVYNGSMIDPGTVVMIDMIGDLYECRDVFGGYIYTGDNSYIIARDLYKTLRDAEQLAIQLGYIKILINFKNRFKDLDDAIYDRLFRASSGKIIHLIYNKFNTHINSSSNLIYHSMHP